MLHNQFTSPVDYVIVVQLNLS